MIKDGKKNNQQLKNDKNGKIYKINNKPFWLVGDLVNIFSEKHKRVIDDVIRKNGTFVITINDSEFAKVVNENQLNRSEINDIISVGKIFCGIECILKILNTIKSKGELITKKEIVKITGISYGNLGIQKQYYGLDVEDGYDENSFLCVVFILLNRIKNNKSRKEIRDIMIKKGMIKKEGCFDDKKQNSHICSFCNKTFKEREYGIFKSGGFMHKECYHEKSRIEKGYIYKCPKCEGNKRKGENGQEVTCSLCGGLGFTKYKYKPVTIIKYEKVE